MKIAVVVDIDSNDHETQVRVQQVRRRGSKLYPVEKNKEDNPFLEVAALCEGLVLLMHSLENAGVQDSPTTLKQCIDHLEQGFIDATYKAERIKP